MCDFHKYILAQCFWILDSYRCSNVKNKNAQNYFECITFFTVRYTDDFVDTPLIFEQQLWTVDELRTWHFVINFFMHPFILPNASPHLPPRWCSFSLLIPHFSLSFWLSPLLTHAVRSFSLIHQYAIVQPLPFSDANYLPKWGCEALCLPAQSFIDRSVS